MFCHGEHRARTAEVESAVANHLHDHLVRGCELDAERHAAGPAKPAAAGADAGVRLRPLKLQQAGAGVADAFVADDVVGLEQLVQLGEQIVRIDLARRALVGRHLRGGVAPSLAFGAVRLDTLLGGLLELRRRLLLELLQQLPENDTGVALHAEIAREGPHRRRGLQRVDIDMRPERLVLVRHVGREPRHVHVHQQADVGLGQMLVRGVSEEAREFVRDVEGLVAFEHRDAGEHRQLLDQLRRVLRLSGITADEDRVFGSDEFVGKLRDHRRVGAAGLRLCELVARVAADLVARPLLRQRLALRHEIDRAGRLGFHDGVGAAERLLHHDAGRQGPFPFHVRPHQRALVDRLLNEMHVSVARTDQLVAGRVGRLARHQQHRQTTAEHVVHRVRSVSRADIDVHQHGLAASGHRRVTHRHMRRCVLVRAEHHVRHLLAALVPVCQRLDRRRMVGAEVAEQVLDAEFVQALDEVIGGGVLGSIADLAGGGGLRHGY